MITIRVFYKDSTDKVIDFDNKVDMSNYIAENYNDILVIKIWDNNRKIKIITTDGSVIVRSIEDDDNTLEAVARICQMVKLDESRIKSIDVLEKRIHNV